MEIKREFIVKEHEELGHIGLCMVDYPWADAALGFTIVHDMMEHSADDSGTVEDELRALGAMCFVRGESWFSNRYGFTGMDAVIASEIVSQVSMYNVQNIKPCDKKMPMDRTIQYLFDAETMYAELKKELIAEQVEAKHNLFQRWTTKRVIDWLNVGYCQAKERYADSFESDYWLSDVFKKAEQTISKQLPENSLIEGTEYSITIDTVKNTCIIEEKYDDSYDDEEENA